MPRARSVQRDAARFGAIIRQMRLDRGWNLKTCARFADIDVTYLSLLERGLNIPSLVMVLNLAQMFGVDAGDLVREVAAGRQRRVVAPTVPSIPLPEE